jgi:hypothetical protein
MTYIAFVLRRAVTITAISIFGMAALASVLLLVAVPH